MTRFLAHAAAASIGVALLATLLVGFPIAPAQADDPEFCWKDTYGRGVGTIPDACGPGREKIGLLCYSKCPAGTARFGFDCHSVCPAGMRDDGLFCRKAEYGRGAGYPWVPADGFSDAGMFRRCEADHGRNNCEKHGLIVYPKCAPGYEPFGCCICRPKVPDCPALGLNPGIDLSCAKKVYIGDPVPMVCSGGKEKDAGLCYPKCDPGFDGVGPVCWGKAPDQWVNCGMGAAVDGDTCRDVIIDQVMAVGELAWWVGSLGVGNPGKFATGSAKYQELKKKFDNLVDNFEELRRKYPEIEEAIENAQMANDIKGILEDISQMRGVTRSEDMIRLAAEIMSLFDSTGISSTIAAYTYPVCSDYGFGVGRASLYQHGNYQGYEVSLPVGRYTLDELRARGVVNDDISSVRVTPGFRLTVYEHGNFTGWSKIFDSDASWIGNRENDQVSAVVVEAR